MTSLPDPFPRELLAAYADGELGPEDRATVERWLAAHPEGMSELQAQRELSPANVGFWERAEPPEPSDSAWAAVERQIAARLDPSPSAPAAREWRRGAWGLGGLVAAGIAAAVAWMVFGPTPQASRTPAGGEIAKAPAVAPAPREVPPRPALVAGFAVLPIATDDDVILERVPDMETGWLPVGRHPLPPVVVLATVEEVELEDADPSPLWPSGRPRMTNAPGDIPMIYAARPR